MFKHLINKPSQKTVSDIIKNAVEIEQVDSSSFWAPTDCFHWAGSDPSPPPYLVLRSSSPKRSLST